MSDPDIVEVSVHWLHNEPLSDTDIIEVSVHWLYSEHKWSPVKPLDLTGFSCIYSVYVKPESKVS